VNQEEGSYQGAASAVPGVQMGEGGFSRCLRAIPIAFESTLSVTRSA
jgi:hypothetical protein